MTLILIRDFLNVQNMELFNYWVKDRLIKPNKWCFFFSHSRNICLHNICFPNIPSFY